MTMAGLRSFLRIALIIALALFLFVILGFALFDIPVRRVVNRTRLVGDHRAHFAE
jgi:hypothetical protein